MTHRITPNKLSGLVMSGLIFHRVLEAKTPQSMDMVSLAAVHGMPRNVLVG